MNHVAVNVKFLHTFARIKAGREAFENQGLWIAEKGFGKASPVQGCVVDEGGLEYIRLAEHSIVTDLPCVKKCER